MLVLALAAALPSVPAGDDPGRRECFQFPEAMRPPLCKFFSDSSGIQVVYLVDQVRGIKTNPVFGEYTVQQALDQMLSGTLLQVTRDSSTGALAIIRHGFPPAKTGRVDALSGRALPTSPGPKPAQNNMTKSHPFHSLLASLFVLAGAAQTSSAQNAGQAANSDENVAGQDTIVKMSALEVTTTQGHGYVATESSEGLKSHSSLMDIPQVDFVITSDLIKDVGFENDTEMLSYFGSGGGSDPGEGAKLRGGGSSSAIYIDEFPEHAQWSDPATFDSIELIKGDTEAVYMLNSGLGGIILQVEKKAPALSAGYGKPFDQ